MPFGVRSTPVRSLVVPSRSLTKSGPTFRSRVKGGFAALAALIMTASGASAENSCIDLALVFSIDASSSISDEEYRLQIRGITTALQSPEVLRIINAAGDVAMAGVIWGPADLPKQRVPWLLLRSEKDVRSFSMSLEKTPRPLRGTTGLGAGLHSAMQMFDSLDVCANRRVLNVSGDGTDTRSTRHFNSSPSPSQVRDLAEAVGVEINALLIVDKEPDLKSYFEEHVLAGPAAFAVEVASYRDIAQGFHRKLVREISPPQVSSLARSLSGERR